tara:strand:+ start:890 stop:2347 length:1458 start_codon:yes stop_codon:yes gene_type:complete
VDIRGNPPVEDLGDTYRVWGDIEHLSTLPNLAKVTRDVENNSDIIVGYSSDGWVDNDANATADDYALDNVVDSTHLRYITTDSEIRKNETRLIVCKARILRSDIEDTGTLEYTHSIRIHDDDAKYFQDGDDVYIKSTSTTNPLDFVMIRGRLRDVDGDDTETNYEIVATNADTGYGNDLACTDMAGNARPECRNRETIMYNRNKFAVSTAIPTENETTKFMAGDEIEVTEKNEVTTHTFTITGAYDTDGLGGIIHIDGDLNDFSHIESKLGFSHDFNDTTQTEQTRSLEQLSDPDLHPNRYKFPFVKNITKPCFIQIHSQLDLPTLWNGAGPGAQDPFLPNGTYIVFDGRHEGLRWTIQWINTQDRKILYVLPSDDSGEFSMLCEECGPGWKVVASNEYPRPATGPRSMAAPPQPSVRDHNVDEIIYKPGALYDDDDLINDAIDLENAEYWPYNNGFELDPQGNRILITYGKRVDYITINKEDMA